ncbi:N-acetyl-anhydromuramoyl-L-alanine amidase [Cupriavidus metallidurans]
MAGTIANRWPKGRGEMSDAAGRVRDWQPDADGWIPAARRVPSPNFDARPEGMAVDVVVLHNISLPPGQFGSDDIEAFFQNRLDATRHPFFETIRDVRVSAHFLIRRDGEPVQFVACTQRAWHAGQSDYCGRQRCNDFSIGIEIEGADDQPFTPAQYETVAALVSALRAAYPIQGVAGHSDIAPGRKTDPGPHFDWSRFAKQAALPPAMMPYRHAR